MAQGPENQIERIQLMGPKERFCMYVRWMEWAFPIAIGMDRFASQAYIHIGPVYLNYCWETDRLSANN